jgi:predicted transcriptional regulator
LLESTNHVNRRKSETRNEQDQPEDSTYDELLRELAFRRMVNRGLADSAAGRVVSNEEMSRQIQSWRK